MKKISLPLEKIDPLFEKIGELTQTQRILIYAGVFVILLGAFIYASYLPKFKKIDKLGKEYKKLEKKLASAKKSAAELEGYRKKMEAAQDEYDLAKKKLPEKEEIPSLLASISQSGQDVGLDFLLFEPKPEVIKEFYIEIPVSIKVKGNYHNVALFFDKVGKLSRIVNIKDIRMAPVKNEDEINTSCTAVTYKFKEGTS
jgi:type IV pilus assembly protein PilO